MALDTVQIALLGGQLLRGEAWHYVQLRWPIRISLSCIIWKTAIQWRVSFFLPCCQGPGSSLMVTVLGLLPPGPQFSSCDLQDMRGKGSQSTPLTGFLAGSHIQLFDF